MSLIGTAIFEGEIFIPQLSQLDVQESLQGFIDKYEPKLLRKLLGVPMYTELAAGMAVAPPNVPDPKWTALMGGAEYDDGTKYWDGLGVLIADYVYWFFMFDYNVHTVQVGVAKPKSENAAPASPVHKMVRAWNEFVDLTCNMHEFIKHNAADYPDYAHADRGSICGDCHCGCGCGHKALFEKKNSLGL